MYRGEFSVSRREYKTGEDGKQTTTDVWEVTDVVTVFSPATMAGVLRAKADELDPPKTERGSY
jgi:hypothetical protein